MLELNLEALRRHLPAFEVTGEGDQLPPQLRAQEKHFGERVYVYPQGAHQRARGRARHSSRAAWARSSYIRARKGNPRIVLLLAPRGGAPHEPNEAKRPASRAPDLIAQTRASKCRKDKGVLDEIRGALQGYRPG